MMEIGDAKVLIYGVIGIVVGLLVGYQLNLEKTAQAMATEQCGVCQENVKIMVGNFNSLAQQCDFDNKYKDVTILPKVINETVRVYGP